MINKWSLVIIIGLSLQAGEKTSSPVPGDIAFQYRTADAVLLEVYETHDAAGMLEGYRSHIITPVCEEGLCYPAELDMEWDVLGNFVRFQVDPDKPLTKLDHIPFSDADYEKLNGILLTESPSFIHLRREELIVKPDPGKPEGVDGMTGATVKAVKQDLVEGAIYTCYTLWHIANGGIKFRIQEHSRKQLEETLIRKLLKRGPAAVHYFLIEHMDARYFRPFFREITELAGQYDAFFAARVLEKLPDELLAEPATQEFFLQQFPRLQYAAQQLWISRLEAVDQVQTDVLLFLTDQIQANDQPRTEQIIGLILKKAGSAGAEAFRNLLPVLADRAIPVDPSALELLRKIAGPDRQLKKIIKRLKK